MFGLLRQFSQLRLAGEVHSPACVDGKFVASDNFVGNSDEGNRLKAKGVCVERQPARARPLVPCDGYGCGLVECDACARTDWWLGGAATCRSEP